MLLVISFIFTILFQYQSCNAGVIQHGVYHDSPSGKEALDIVLYKKALKFEERKKIVHFLQVIFLCRFFGSIKRAKWAHKNLTLMPLHIYYIF